DGVDETRDGTAGAFEHNAVLLDERDGFLVAHEMSVPPRKLEACAASAQRRVSAAVRLVAALRGGALFVEVAADGGIDASADASPLMASARRGVELGAWRAYAADGT